MKQATGKRRVSVKSRKRNGFYEDVLNGLSAAGKYLESKYFYNAEGDRLFQEIMRCPEYYVTRCEAEILQQQSASIIRLVRKYAPEFDIVELGAGDATKSVHLLQAVEELNMNATSYPIDISSNVTDLLAASLPGRFSSIHIEPLNGEYFDMLVRAGASGNKPKLILFLGSNIGNMSIAQAAGFLQRLRESLEPGDMLFIGFDLKKDPAIILDAYNDSQGFTRQFNLNLLTRINDELDGNFNIEHFYHYPVYDPGTGACKSYLVSSCRQDVRVGDRTVSFEESEPIFMEVSQKYSMNEILRLGSNAGYEHVAEFYDSRGWFTDVVWRVGENV